MAMLLEKIAKSKGDNIVRLCFFVLSSLNSFDTLYASLSFWIAVTLDRQRAPTKQTAKIVFVE
jgi:hypothetical protein